MENIGEVRVLLPSPDNDDWVGFLDFIADGSSALTARDGAAQIISVIEKPHNYGDEYTAYLEERRCQEGAHERPPT